MRYDNWDVILFPKDSHIPIQEFKTACYHACDANTESLKAPTLTCYISSLPPATPFRISIHSWINPAKPSAVVQAQQKSSQKIMYMVQVIVDGVTVFQVLYDTASKWPQEIVHEKRHLIALEQATSERKPRLEFPTFSQHTLMQSAWQSRESSGRINLVLSEQLVNKHGNEDKVDLGISNDIVRFSFQHAPRDILEQAGISWPIRNPLYLPDAYDGCDATQNSTQSTLGGTKTQNSPPDPQTQSPLSHTSGLIPGLSQSHDMLQRPRSHPPPLAHFFKPPHGGRNSNRSDIWEDSFGSFRDNHDNVSLGSWPTQPSGSHPGGDIFTSGYNASIGPFRALPSWPSRPTDAQRRMKPSSNGQQQIQDKQIVVTLRDDQLGRIIHAISPPKTLRNLPHDRGAQHMYSGRPPSNQLFNPLTSFVPRNSQSSAATFARKSSYSDLTAAQRNMSKRRSSDKLDTPEMHKNKSTLISYPSASSNKENLPPSQSRVSTPFPYADQVPTTNPFAPTLSQWCSGMPTRDDSTMSAEQPVSQTSRTSILSEIHNKHGAAHAPSNSTGVKSRKEGMAPGSRMLSERRTRHDQSLLPPTTGKVATSHEHRENGMSTPNMLPKPSAAAVEVIDVDALDPDLDHDTKTPSLDMTKLSTNASHHKQGVSSVNSLGSVERKVITYVGAEVSRGASEPHDDTKLGQLENDADNDTIVVSMGGRVFETAAKRKRGTLNAEGARKREKGEHDEADEHGELEIDAEGVELPKLTDD
ncbi:hypothetical protein DE146DRAFT_150734 [Phaeosphaeria sp. MPI-PUGE-AT-0046c]|nr:hypothetical protein DE146DRAFT_150734 [Phaeosphaeria sp. MPI-PUGE-AT-0046c]